MARKYGRAVRLARAGSVVMILMGENAVRRTTFGLLTVGRWRRPLDSIAREGTDTRNSTDEKLLRFTIACCAPLAVALTRRSATAEMPASK